MYRRRRLRERTTRTESNHRLPKRAEVAVVGAGLAGLTDTRLLHHAGVDVIVLEARERIGGRTLNHQLGGGQVIEVGGQWVGPLPGEPAQLTVPVVQNPRPWPQARILALASAIGVSTYKGYNEGDYIDYASSSPIPRTRYSGTTRMPLDPSAANAALAIVRVDEMATQVPLDAPWTAEQAEYRAPTRPPDSARRSGPADRPRLRPRRAVRR